MPAKKYLSQFIPVLLIILLGISVYSNTLQSSFHYDDRLFIIDNPTIRDISDLEAMWNFFPTHSRFIALISFALNYHFHGLDVFGYHLTNLIIHLLTGLLVFSLTKLFLNIRKIDHETALPVSNTTIALAAALIFIAHPVQTQAITYISQRMASLATLFYLLSLLFYLKGRVALPERAVAWLYFFGCFISGLAGMLTKEIVITLPLMILLVEWFFFKKERRIDYRNKYFWALIILVVTALLVIPALFNFRITQRLFAERISMSHPGETITLGAYVLTQFRVLAVFLRLLFLPYGQNLDYDFPLSQSLFEPATFLSFVLLTGVFILGVKLYSKDKLLSFCVFWFFLTLAANFVPRRFIIFEHKLYLASFGFALFLPLAFAHLIKNKRMYTVVMVIILTGFSALAYQRNNVWKTEITLWEDVVKKSPHKANSHHNLGAAYFKAGQYDRALARFNRAIELDPLHKQAYNFRGNTYIKLGRIKEGLADYDQAIQIAPAYEESYYNKGVLYQKLNNESKALEQYTKALELKPDYVAVYNNRAGIFIKRKQFEKALADMSQAIEFDPFQQPLLYANRAKLYQRLRQYQAALADYNRIKRQDPDNLMAYFKSAELYWRMNDVPAAIKEVEKVLRIDPDNRAARQLHAKLSGLIK